MSIKGIGKLSRLRLSKVLRYAKGYITPKLVASCLNISRKSAQSFLGSWEKRGWLCRLRNGIYLSVDLSAESSDEVLVDPWKIAGELFAPCYISGWSAAEYWNLTEQIFETTLVLTTKPIYKKQYALSGARFLLKKIPHDQLFGIEIVWRDRIKVQVADLHKTIVDMLDDPSLGGGVFSVIDFLQAYLSSSESDFRILLEYASKMKNKTIFKRLGFLLSILSTDKGEIIEYCLQNISKGNSQLDPNLRGSRLIKKWGLWVPQGFEKLKKEKMT